MNREELRKCRENIRKLNIRIDWIQEEIQSENVEIGLDIQRWLDELEVFAMEAKENIEEL